MQAFSNRVIGSLWVLSDADRQTTDLQRDALLAAGVDERHRFQDQASGARDDRPGLAQALTFLQPGDGRMGWKRDRLGRPPAPPDRERERVKDGRGRLARADRADGYRDPARGAAVSSVRGTGPVRAGADSGADPGGLGGGAAAGPPGQPAKGTRCGAPGGGAGGFEPGRKHGGGVPDLRYSAQYPLRGAEAGELKER